MLIAARSLILVVVAAIAAAGTAAPSPKTLQLSPDPGTRKLNPVFLADGRNIVFSALIDGDWDLLMRTPDGASRRWVSNRLWEGVPGRWRGQGRMTFERFDRARGTSEMWSAKPDGSEERRIGVEPGFRPKSSPDGKMIAYDNYVPVEPGRSTHQLFVMNADGSGVRRLTETLSYDASATWSPDGKRIAFDSQRDDPSRDIGTARSEIYVMDADGSRERRLTRLNGRSRYASWSPRSDAIVFEVLVGGNWDLYVVRADKHADPVRLTATPGMERTPSWSPDGRRILYAYEVDGTSEIRVMDAPPSVRCRFLRLTFNRIFFPVFGQFRAFLEQAESVGTCTLQEARNEG